jgi:hypothetical protein
MVDDGEIRRSVAIGRVGLAANRENQFAAATRRFLRRCNSDARQTGEGNPRDCLDPHGRFSRDNFMAIIL